MTRSPDSLIPSRGEQVAVEKRDDKALIGRQEGEANLRAATDVNAVTASSYPPACRPTQLEHFSGRTCPLEVKPVTDRVPASTKPVGRDGVEGGSTQKQHIGTTGEALFGPAEAAHGSPLTGREAYKSEPSGRIAPHAAD